MTRLMFSALLYATLASGANAAGLDDATRSQIDALRQGDMRKLVLSDGRDLSAAGFTDADGTPQTLADSTGKVRIVNFWATWCGPCRAEKPTLDALNADLQGPGFEVLAIATGRNSNAAIKRFNAENGIESLATYLDPDGAMARELGVFGLPVSILINGEGTEIGRLTGGTDWSSESARAIVEALIAAGS